MSTDQATMEILRQLSTEMVRINQEVARTKKMLIALHRNSPLNNYHWIEGYAIGAATEEGMDGKRGVFVLLYAVGENMPTPTVKVYKSDNRELPLFISSVVKWDEPEEYPEITGKGAEKGNLKKKGKFVECPKFAIIRYDGKVFETGPQKKLACVIEMSYEAHKKETEAQAKAKQNSQAPAATQATPPPAATAQATTAKAAPPAKQVQPPVASATSESDNPFTPAVQQKLVPEPVKAVETGPVVMPDRITALEWAVTEGMFPSKEVAGKQYDAWLATWKPETQTIMLARWVTAIRYMQRRAEAIQKAMRVKAFASETDAIEEFDSIRKQHKDYSQDQLFQAWEELLVSIAKVGKAVQHKYGEGAPA